MALDVAPPLDALIPFRPPEHETWLPDSVGKTSPLSRDPACKRCALSAAKGLNTICIPTYYSAPALGDGHTLAVMGTPTQRDDAAGAVAYGGGTALAIDELKKAGAFRITYALRCAAGRGAEESDVVACRPYLAREVNEAARVVCMGKLAALSVLGHELDARRIRRARAVVRGKPVFVVADPVDCSRNRFWKQQFRDDVAWALAAPAEPEPDGAVSVFLKPAHAALWLAGNCDDSPRPGRPLVIDCEHWPKNPWAPGDFRLLCLGLCTDVRSPYVIPEEVLKDADVRERLKRVLENPAIPKVNQNIKHDRHVLWRVMRIDVLGVEHDTLLYAKLLDSENPAGLGALSWRTGYGGVKALGQQEEEEDEDK